MGYQSFLSGQTKVDESQDPARGENWRKEQMILLSKARIFNSLALLADGYYSQKEKKWGVAEGERYRDLLSRI